MERLAAAPNRLTQESLIMRANNAPGYFLQHTPDAAGAKLDSALDSVLLEKFSEYPSGVSLKKLHHNI